MQSGGKGDVVSVRNVDSGRTVKGTVEDDGSINVGGP
jgi:flagella basal body P-ring formation protein FlgA